VATADDLTTLQLKIKGQVQAVGFREFAIREANIRALTGWVRNRTDGTVEIVASGPTKEIEAFVGACMRGPPGARVTDVDMGPAEVPDSLGFKRRPTV
jgi:acylphosphatase